MENTALSIAHIRFMMSPSKTKIRTIFTMTLRELVYKEILSLAKINSFPNDRSRKTQKYWMIQKGPKYKPEPDFIHEKSFLSPLEELDQVRVKNLTNYVLRNYPMPSLFIKTNVYSYLKKEGYLTGIPLLKSFGIYSITPNGKQVIEEINHELEQHEETLRGLIEGDKQAFYDALTQCGTKVFLIESRDPELYNNIISMTKRIKQTKPLGPDKDLRNFSEAFDIDVSFLDEG